MVTVINIKEPDINGNKNLANLFFGEPLQRLFECNLQHVHVHSFETIDRQRHFHENEIILRHAETVIIRRVKLPARRERSHDFRLGK